MLFQITDFQEDLLVFLIQTLKLSPAQSIDEIVAKAYEEGNIPAIEEYVMRDVEATHNLFEKLKGYIIK